MAKITGAQNERVFQLKKWLGLNESPSGDTKLKFGEAAEMRNWHVTRDGNLRKRPGTKEVLTLERGEAVRGVWAGLVGVVERVIAACGTKLYSCWAAGAWSKTEIGTIAVGSDDDELCMFGFDDKFYIISGGKYYCYDGSTLSEVTAGNAYVPLVAVAVPPLGGGSTLEQVNKLTGKRRIWFSPDGTATTFQLPEKGLVSIDYAKKTSDGSALTISSRDLANGTLTFASAPAQGTSTIEVGYTAVSMTESAVGNYRFAETYNGSQDTRVFLYGDGTNQTIYSGLDYDGKARADYFPDLNVVNVGISNTPITALVRHGSLLLAFKPDSTYNIQYGQITLQDGTLTAAFYITPVNRSIGNDAPGQVQLVMNTPYTIYQNDIYEWVGNRYGNLTNDERQVRRISDRVTSSMRLMHTERCRTVDDNNGQEWYLSDWSTGNTLVYSYAVDAWTMYTNLAMYRPFCFKGGVYFGNRQGGITELSDGHLSDAIYEEADGAWAEAEHAIDCYWESGSESFGADYQRKYSAMLWVGVKPDNGVELHATVETDRSASYNNKVISTGLFSFIGLNFADFSFNAMSSPRIDRLKIKAKKFVYYKLILTNNTTDRTATVTTADIRVRFTGYAK